MFTKHPLLPYPANATQEDIVEIDEYNDALLADLTNVMPDPEDT